MESAKMNIQIRISMLARLLVLAFCSAKDYSSKSLLQTFYDQALPLLATRHAQVQALSNASKDAWEQRQVLVKPKLKQLFGLILILNLRLR